MAGIWWLASYPKSGNTWLRVALATLLSGRPADINAMPLVSLVANNRAMFDHALGIESADLTNEQETDLRPRVYESGRRKRRGRSIARHTMLIAGRRPASRCFPPRRPAARSTSCAIRAPSRSHSPIILASPSTKRSCACTIRQRQLRRPSNGCLGNCGRGLAPGAITSNRGCARRFQSISCVMRICTAIRMRPSPRLPSSSVCRPIANG